MCAASRLLAGVVTLSTLAFATPAPAQTPAPGFEVFAGYSLLPADEQDDFPRKTSHGGQVSVAANFRSWFGLFADVSLHFNSATYPGPVYEGAVARSTVRTYFVGPRFTARSERVDLFAHGLVGLVQGDAGEDFSGFSDSGLALGGGGGVDVRVLRRLAVRAQVDLIGAFVDIVETNPRFAVGLVARIGGS
jgi:hypothetical protein